MSLSENLKKDQLGDFIGPNGASVLIKALKKVFNQDEEILTKTLDNLQIKNRALCSWISLLAKKTVEPGDGIKVLVPSTKHTLELIKAGTNIYTAIINDTIIEGKDLPYIASQLMLMPEFEENLNKSEIQSLPQVQEVVTFLVKSFLFPDKKHNTLNLTKAEGRVRCADCGEMIKINDQETKLCFCYAFMGKSSLHIAKSEAGLKITFSDKWDKSNILLLTQALKNTLKK